MVEEQEEAERDLAWENDGWQRRELLKHVGTDALLAGLAVVRPAAEKTLPALRRLVRRKAGLSKEKIWDWV